MYRRTDGPITVQNIAKGTPTTRSPKIPPTIHAKSGTRYEDTTSLRSLSKFQGPVGVSLVRLVKVSIVDPSDFELLYRLLSLYKGLVEATGRVLMRGEFYTVYCYLQY